MRCFQATRWLSAYIDGELDPRRRVALEAHLKNCEACSAELERFKEHWEALAEGDQVPPMPTDLWGQILASLDESKHLPWHRRYRTRLLQAACVATCIVLGFSGGALLSWEKPPADDAPDRISMGERMLVAEAFDVTALGLTEGKEGLLQCVPK